MNKDWADFYKERTYGDGYSIYFKEKYNLFISHIQSFIKNSDIKFNYVEEGCGIGSVIKAITNNNIITENEFNSITLLDNNVNMLSLCSNYLNYFKNVEFKKANILDNLEFKENSIVITHGVLEHFSHREVGFISDKYKDPNISFQAHYVPLNGYNEPSFGDEHLLPANYWITMFKPSMYIVNDNGKDLFMFK